MRRKTKTVDHVKRLDDLAVKQGYYFDTKAADFVCEFIETFIRHSKGKWAGKPFVLQPWQRDYLRRLYGWKRPDGRLRYREVYIEIPKKNGKSTLEAAQAIFELIKEPGAEVYVGAVNRKQASIIFDECVAMIRQSPALAKRFRIIPSQKKVLYPANNAKLIALSADVPSQDGVSSSCTIIDETHRFRTPDLYEVMKYAGAARESPVLVSITTAGHDRQSLCYRLHERARKILDGLDDDLHFLPIIYAAENNDINSPKTWRLANPCLGVTINEQDFADEFKEAKEQSTLLNNFLRLRLNIWTQSETRFLDRAKWDACGERFDPEVLKGVPVYAGLDLSSTGDTTSLVLVAPLDDVVYVLPFFWIPKANAALRQRRDRVPYLTWARKGLLTMTDGDVIDYEFIVAKILELAQECDLRQLNFDPYNGYQVSIKLAAEGLPLNPFRQGFLSMNAPTKELERLVKNGQIRHGGHDVLTWQADLAVAVSDPADNLKIAKGKARERVDGVVALVMALAGWMSDEAAYIGDQLPILG